MLVTLPFRALLDDAKPRIGASPRDLNVRVGQVART
jgi:hypothetical protein